MCEALTVHFCLLVLCDSSSKDSSKDRSKDSSKDSSKDRRSTHTFVRTVVKTVVKTEGVHIRSSGGSDCSLLFVGFVCGVFKYHSSSFSLVLSIASG